MIWISVEERLPEELQKVLFFWSQQDLIMNIAMGFRIEDTWNIYLPYASYQLDNREFKVIHWAELPAYPNQETCKHKNMDYTPMYQCPDCKKCMEIDCE